MIRNWNKMGCRVPHGYHTEVRRGSGEFLHIMSLVDGKAGDQLQSLSLNRALAAVREIAKLHAKFWGKTELKGWRASFDGLKNNKRLISAMARTSFEKGEGATTTFVRDPELMPVLEAIR